MPEINSKKLKAFRIVELDMTQEDMAEILEVNATTYNRKEQNPGKFFLSEIVTIVNYANEKLSKEYKVEDIFFS